MKEKKIAIITGGSSGIGRAICNDLVKNGYVVLNFDKKKYEKYNIIFVKTNLENSVSIKKNFRKIIKKFKNPSVLINNAAITISNQFVKYSKKDWEKTFKINLFAPFYLSQLFSKNLINKKTNGSIINITSIGAELAFPDNPAYQSSKAGLKHLTKSLSYDLAKYGIRANNIVPGYTKGGMNKKSWNNLSLRNKRSQKTMLKRWADPSEISNAVLFLISKNSSYITGTDLIVDGGWTSKGL